MASPCVWDGAVARLIRLTPNHHTHTRGSRLIGEKLKVRITISRARRLRPTAGFGVTAFTLPASSCDCSALALSITVQISFSASGLFRFARQRSTWCRPDSSHGKCYESQRCAGDSSSRDWSCEKTSARHN